MKQAARFALAASATFFAMPAAARDARVESLLVRMSVREKAGQLTQFSAGEPTGPGTNRDTYEAMIVAGEVGSLLNVTEAARANAYQKLAVERSRLHIPLLFAFDVIHGFRTIFPINLGLAATWDLELVEKVARLSAEEASRQGIRWTFSPMVDIARDARWGRIAEGAGEDPYLGARMAAAYVRGYQGGRLDDPSSILACAKHFAGYGAAEAGRDYNSTEISERTLRQVYLPPFQASVEAGAATIMAAFNAVSGIPATAHPWLLDRVLRREWEFAGLVVSDWTAVAELMAHGIANQPAEAVRKAFLAGVDIDMESGLYLAELPALVASGRVPVTKLDQAVRRVLGVKTALGLFARPYATGDAAPTAPLPESSLALARTAAERSFVLLRNQPVRGVPLLPLDCDQPRTVGLLGPLADSAADMLGAWSGRGQASDVVTLRAALVQRSSPGGMQVLHATGSGGNGEAARVEAVAAARRADVVILALGEKGIRTGEAASRAYLGLDPDQQALLVRVMATGKPVVLLLFSGRPLTLAGSTEGVPAMLAAWFPGVQAGPALVRVLCGDVEPGGRLTATFPRTVGQEPLYYNALSTGRPTVEAVPGGVVPPASNHFTSRYIDELSTPLFAFGHGLTYTSFSYSPVEASVEKLSATAVNRRRATLTVSATVTNSGRRAGSAVAQCYLRLRGTSVARPVRELAGFRRVELAPGQSARVAFTLGKEELGFWIDSSKRTVEPAALEVWIAPDSASGSPARLPIER